MHLFTFQSIPSFKVLAFSTPFCPLANASWSVYRLNGAETRESGNAALVEDIYATFERSMRRSLTDAVLNPLASVVLTSVRQASDPLTVS